MVKDAMHYATLIRTKQMSPEELIDDVMDKVKKQSDLNAFVTLDADRAKRQLAKLTFDASLTPFFGVPFVFKDLGQAQMGVVQTSGSRLLKENISRQSDYFVEKIEQAGFLSIGTTTAPEFGFKNITDPVIYGPTLNPWNKEKHAGGSSGGAAAVVASGILPLAGASDGGGSIRIPASFCGLVGFKPSRGRVVTGPSSWRSWQGASVNFTLGVSIRDAESMLEIVKSDHQISPFTTPIASLPVVNRPLKIAVCYDSPMGNPVSDDAKQAVKEACQTLESLGHEVEWIDYPINGQKVMESYYTMNAGETAAMMKGMENQLYREMTINDMELMSWTLYQYGKTLSAADYSLSLDVWDDATYQMETLFEEYDLFLSPTATTVAPNILDDLQSDKIRREMVSSAYLSQSDLSQLVFDMFEKSLIITPYTQLANLTGQPAISLPTYLTKESLPIGIQFMASKGNDKLLLEVGRWFEELGHFKLPLAYQD